MPAEEGRRVHEFSSSIQFHHPFNSPVLGFLMSLFFVVAAMKIMGTPI
jgi:hypothetical protein